MSLFPSFLAAQHPDPALAIRELKAGYLIVRIPTYTAKIDTLTALMQRTYDPGQKAKLQKRLAETIGQRDTLLADYVKAFKNQYHFSSVAYFFDYDAHNPPNATYYNLEGKPLAFADLSEKPIFYLYFERTEESKIDALVIYDQSGHIIPSPFPNNFSRGGTNFLFLKISEKNFPAWRVGKINKQFFKFWSDTGGMQ